MVSLKNMMETEAAKLGTVEFKGLITKTARIKNGVGIKSSDILGWTITEINY